MKNKFHITICLLLFTSFAIAQYSNILRTSVDESEVPEEVKRTQRLEFPDGFVTGWKYHTKENNRADDISYYMASFKKRGRLGNSAFYNTNGDLLSYVLYINGKDIPESIQVEAINSLNDSFIKSAELIDLENPRRQIYRIRLNNIDGALKYIYYDINGAPLDKRNLPSEIFVFI